MRGEFRGDQVVLTLDPDEAAQLVAALAEGPLTMSRTEYYIRTGGSLPQLQTLADGLKSLVTDRAGTFEVTLREGAEADDNPRHARP